MGCAAVREVLRTEHDPGDSAETDGSHAQPAGDWSGTQQPLGVLNVTLDTQRQSLSALQQQECVERRNGSTGITQQDSADVGYESSRTNCICKEML